MNKHQIVPYFSRVPYFLRAWNHPETKKTKHGNGGMFMEYHLYINYLITPPTHCLRIHTYMPWPFDLFVPSIPPPPHTHILQCIPTHTKVPTPTPCYYIHSLHPLLPHTNTTRLSFFGFLRPPPPPIPLHHYHIPTLTHTHIHAHINHRRIFEA